MLELLRTNDVVALSYATALLRDAEIGHMVMDENMSVLEGSVGVLPRRLLIEREACAQAVRLLDDAGLAHLIGDQARTA